MLYLNRKLITGHVLDVTDNPSVDGYGDIVVTVVMDGNTHRLNLDYSALREARPELSPEDALWIRPGDKVEATKQRDDSLVGVRIDGSR